MKFHFLLIIQVISSLIISIPAFAEIKTVTHTLKQPFGGSQSPDDARIAGIARAKREALEQFGTYIESTTVVKNAQVDSDEILALTAGVTKAEVIKQKNYADGDAFGIEITVNVELDTAVLEKSLKRLLEDRGHLKDLKESREREKKLLARVVELEKKNQLKGKNKEQTAKLKKEFKSVSQGLTAVEWAGKANAYWSDKENRNPNITIEYLTQAIKLDPNYASAYFNRGQIYMELNQFDRAISDYDQAIRLDSSIAKDGFAYNNRGVAYMRLEKCDRAIADFDLAIRLSPNYAKAYANRGIAYKKLEQFNRSILDYGEAIRLDPTNADSYIGRGGVYDRLNQYDKAIVDLSQAIELDPNSAYAYNNRGAVYLQLNNSFLGCSDLKKACYMSACFGYEDARQNLMCR